MLSYGISEAMSTSGLTYSEYLDELEFYDANRIEL